MRHMPAHSSIFLGSLILDAYTCNLPVDAFLDLFEKCGHSPVAPQLLVSN